VPEASFTFQTSEGLTIRGNVHSPARRASPVVVCVHGFKGFKEWGFWPETARRVGTRYGVVRFNFSHSGVGEDLETFSEKDLFESGTYTREVEDLREVLARLERGDLPGSDGLDATRIGLLAHSRGAVSALAVAAGRDSEVASTVLWNPVSSVLWWDEDARRRWRETGSWEVVNARTRQVFHVGTALLDDAERNRDRLDPLVNAARLAHPLLCVVASEDESVSSASGRHLAEAAGGEGSLHEIRATGHTFGAVHPFAGATPALEDALAVTIEQFDRTLARVG
jgi:uncharacterized protein